MKNEHSRRNTDWRKTVTILDWTLIAQKRTFDGACWINGKIKSDVK